MNVAVVILNWNGRALLEKFLPSVVQHSEGATVYVADNASTDSSVAFVRNNFHNVVILRNKTNGGYAKGYNEALEGLSEEIFVLLNSDVEVTENWLAPILNAFADDPSLAAAQPKILDYKNREYFEYAGAAGGFLDKYGYPYCRGRIFNTLEKDHGQYDAPTQIFWASGACLFIRANVFKMVGRLDEDYFAHQEEIDLCWRIGNRGFRIICHGGSSVYHVGGSTLAAANPQKTFYNFRNSLYNLVKNTGGAKIVVLIFTRMVLDGVAALQFVFQGKPRHFWAVFRAHLHFYAALPKLRRKRKSNPPSKSYFTVKSIVFQYFIKGKKYYHQL